MSTSAVNTLLTALRTGQATSPALIWYGSSGERIELSGKVLDNWVAKTSNFLVDELDAEPGLRVRLELPVHWKSLVWILAAWQTGCTVVLGSGGGPAAVTASAAADAAAEGTAVAVALGALDLSYPEDLPPGVVDYAAEIRSYADTFVADGEAGPGVAALEVNGTTGSRRLTGTLTYGDLPIQDGSDARPEVLLAASADLPLVLEGALEAWASGGTVVLTPAGEEPSPRLLESERVTKRLAA